MFLNLHRNDKRLSLDNKFSKEPTYSSPISKFNKAKSYSTSSLKEQFQKFKNKSFSQNNYSSVVSLLRPQPNNSYTNYQPVQRVFPPSRPAVSTTKNLKVNDFKKSYLNLDSKLSKSTKPKDYFRSNYPAHIQQCVPPNSYIEAQKRLQQQNTRRSLVLLDQITLLREQNQLLKQQNEELRKQRSIDLELIARQNQIMKKQQELLQANQDILKEKKYLNENRQTFGKDWEENSIVDFINRNQRNKNCFNLKPTDCQDCTKKHITQNVEIQFYELKIQKIEEEKKLMKKEIHELVYKCEQYKQALKKTQEKYQKQLEHNQKLINIIYNEDKNQKDQQIITRKNEQCSQKNREKPYLNPAYINSSEQSEPISLKSQSFSKQKPKQYYSIEQSRQSLEKRGPNLNYSQSLLSFSDLEIQPTRNKNTLKLSEKDFNFQEKRQNGRLYENKLQSPKHKLNQGDLKWCPNQNIRKYLEQINQQKARQIDRIQNLLSNQ